MHQIRSPGILRAEVLSSAKIAKRITSGRSLMYSGKTVRLRLPIQNHTKELITEKKELRAEKLTRNFIDLSFWRRSAPKPFQTTLLYKMVPVWGKCYYLKLHLVRVVKALAILFTTIVKQLAVKWEDSKPHWKSERRPRFSRWFFCIYIDDVIQKAFTSETRNLGFNSIIPHHVMLCSN